MVSNNNCVILYVFSGVFLVLRKRNEAKKLLDLIDTEGL